MPARAFALSLLLAICAFTSKSQADLILTLTGTNGSNVITYTASGSVTATNATSGLSSGLGLAPISGLWSSSFDNNLGSFLSNSMNTAFNDDLALSNGGVSYRKNGTEFGVLDTLDLDGSTTAGEDDVELDPSSTLNYPSLAVNDVLSWTGSGTFTLEDGETFDSLFVQTGTFSKAIDGGFYRVIIAESTGVPEPGTLAAISGLAGIFVYRRRRKAKKAEAEKQAA